MKRALVLLLLIVFLPAPAYASHTFVVYMSPSGSDASDGLTVGSPVRTLARVQDILAAAAPDKPVEVSIDQGTYVAGVTVWTWFNGYPITFAPDDWDPGEGIDDIAGRPVFRGNSPGWWFEARLPSGHPGGTTGLGFYYLQVEYYGDGGLLIHGGYETDGFAQPSTVGANGNTIVGMYFQKLGSAWGQPSDEFGYAAVDLVNSSDNYIRANHFRYLENAAPDGSHMHGVYLAHGSSRNTVTKNKFYMISGQPVRTRNLSNFNDFGENTMELTSNSSHYGEWFCDETCAAQYPSDHGAECPSQGNYYHDNNQVSHYTGHSQWTWRLVPDGIWYSPPGCPVLTEQRLRTNGNV